MGSSQRQLKTVLRKNWLLKIRHPFATCAEILLPTIVMLMLIGVRTRVDTRIHPTQAYIRKDMFVEVGNSDISPSFDDLLKLCFAKGEHLAFVPDTEETWTMIKFLSLKFPMLQVVGRVYKDELELETYIRSDLYGVTDSVKNCSNPKIKGAIVFHEQGPELFDYSIRLNHSWAFSGFPDVKTIMDTNGPYLNDLALGVDTVPTLQYGLSGFLTLQQVVDSFIIYAAQRKRANAAVFDGGGASLFKSFDFEVDATGSELSKFQASGVFPIIEPPWMHLTPSKIRIVPFPTRAYTDDEFQSIIKKVMGVLYLLGFLYPISRLISYSVFEKEHKIKEGLHMMGLKDEIFYLSWFITYAIQFAISAGIITICTMSTLFQYSDKSVVFTYFFLFGLSAIMLSFLISTFFSRAKTAVAVGTLSFLGAFFPYYTVNDSAVPMMLKVLASLLSPTAFALGTVNFADYERAHVGVRWTNIWQASSGLNFLVCLLMMMFDTVLYCAIGLYLDKVLPREHGVRYPWNFLFTKLFWREKSTFSHLASGSEAQDNDQEWKKKGTVVDMEVCEPAVEAISLDMKKQELDGRCIQVRNLHKIYKTKKGECSAVNSLQLNLYENQILALLGHNGAGKSTTISMLVGLLPPTSGDALVFGKNIRTDMVLILSKDPKLSSLGVQTAVDADEIRKELGVCPQNDILFPELTVKEHLEIFAVLKGVSEDLLENKVNEMVDEVGLADKVNTVVEALSGGMKRKLSLGIALIGNSKVIILDEPTSGMDPYSMRSTWQLIKKKKKGRIILLTTHSMDEADVLGDRIAIMANGSLRCCGSSLFLKHRYGVGYTLTLVKTAPGASVAADIVRRHVPSATHLSDVGTEVSFRLPLASSSSFENMFLEIESHTRRPGTRSETGSDGENHINIESFGISVTTLEEVFLRVAGCDFDGIKNTEHAKAHDGDEHMDYETSPFIKTLNSKQLSGNYLKVFGRFCSTIGRAFTLFCTTFISLLTFLKVQCCGCGVSLRSMFWEHSNALLKKRAISARRDGRTVIFQLLIPALFLFFGLLFLKLKPHPDQISVTLTTSHFNPLLSGGGGGGPIPFNLSFPISNQVSRYVKDGWIQKLKPRSYRFPDADKVLSDAIGAAGPTLGPALVSMSEFLITSLNESYQSRYGAILMDDQNDDGSLGYTVLHNSSCQHGAPTYINLMNSAILRLATNNQNMMIQTRNHPLPMARTQHSQHHDLDAFSAAIIVNIAFSFIPASFAVAIVKEREVKAKHQQLISGVSVLSYWISTYIWDFISFLFPASFAIILFNIFGLDQFIGSDCLLPMTLMFLEYGLAIAASTYCLTFFFSDHSMAQNVVLLVHFFSGLILMVISFIMGLIQATKRANSFLKTRCRLYTYVGSTQYLSQRFKSKVHLEKIDSSYHVFMFFENFFRLSPGFCFADGLASLALRRQGMKLGSGNETFDWNVTGASISYLAIESIVFFIFTIALELFPTHQLGFAMIKDWWKHSYKIFHRKNSESSSEPLLKSFSEGPSYGANDEDIDVRAERHRVLSGSVDNSIIYLHNLRKVYPGGRNHPEKIAVHSLTFSVQVGECFGFLGTNGAGKTTTLSMLSGEECPTDGTAYIFGNDICLYPKAARRHVGYCPQFDALLEFLTPKEHLELYARIKGVPKNTINSVVSEKLMEFDLWKHANKPSYALSGGNKRKLSVAIAMIGDPPIVILDEPSSGMDPIAKRFMWDVISRLSTRHGKTAVILTTHSMNEAQALCTRIGIMVGGHLRCIGSPQHLKTRFGNHLELEVKPSEVSPAELDRLCRRIQETLLDFPCHPRSILSDLEICITGSDCIASASVSEICLTQEMVITIGRLLGNEDRVRMLISMATVTDGVFGEQLSEQLSRDGYFLNPRFHYQEGFEFSDNIRSGVTKVIERLAPNVTFAIEATREIAQFRGKIGRFGDLTAQTAVGIMNPGGIPLRIFSEWWLAKEKFSIIDSFILSSFPGATFQGCNGLSVKYQLPYGETSSLAEIFGHLERNRTQLEIAEYSISQSTLETIFNHFASNP